MAFRTFAIFALCTLPLLSFGERLVAAYGNTRVTQADVAFLATNLSLPYSDPVEVYVRTHDPEQREDARKYIEQEIGEFVFSQFYSAMAKRMGLDNPPDQKQEIERGFYECLGNEYDGHLRDQITSASRQDLRGVFDRLGQQLARPEVRDVSYICLLTTGTTSADEKEKMHQAMEDVRSRIISGQLTFEQAARLYSEAPSAKSGGHIGSVSAEGKLNPKFLGLVFSLEKDNISSVTLLHNGFYIVRVGAIIPSDKPTWAEVEKSPDEQNMLLQMDVEPKISEIRKQVQSKYQAVGANEAFGHFAADAGFRSNECEGRKSSAARHKLAMSCFTEQHAGEIIPTDREIQAYYQEHLDEMFEEGIWQYTKYTVPVPATPGAPIKNRSQAREIANRARKSLLDSPSSGTASQEIQNYSGLVISKSKGWEQGTGDAGADQQMLKLIPGQLTEVFVGDDGACFFRLEAKRKTPTQSFEKAKTNIRNILTATKRESALNRERKALMQKLGVQILWDNLN